MAKVIRNRWVYRPHGKWHRYLPRRNDAVKEYDYMENGATLSDFRRELEEDQGRTAEKVSAFASSSSSTNFDLNAKPSKLWLAWLYRQPSNEPKWTKKSLEELFGKDYKVGRMEIFKNTAATNEDLWKIKHLIELRPVVFANGIEPTEADIGRLKISTNGVVESAPAGEVIDENELRLTDEKKHFTPAQLKSQLARRYFGFKDIHETNVYTPKNRVLIE